MTCESHSTKQNLSELKKQHHCYDMYFNYTFTIDLFNF